MAEAAREEEVEYESDPEEAKLSLKMRRREASDDEEEERRDGPNGEMRDSDEPRRRIVDSDVESDGQGAVADYEDEEEEDYVDEEEDEELIEDDEYVEELEEDYEDGSGTIGGVEAVTKEEEVAIGEKVSFEDIVQPRARESLHASIEDRNFDEIANENQHRDEEVDGENEKKENEPYAVPTAGAFYMHDDRFRGNSGGRHRRTFGGRKLWESKDEKKWGHDKFEELTLQDRHFDKGRRGSRGRYRGRGRNQGAEQGGLVRGNRPRSYNSTNNPNKNNQSNASKSVRGRGPRRYQPSFKNIDEVLPMINQQSGKTAEKPSHSSSGRVSAPVSNAESEAAPAKKHVFASSLNSASPPFYPSASTSKENHLSRKRDVQSGNTNRRIHPSVVDQNVPTAQSNAVQRGKIVVDSMNMEKLYIEDSVSTVSGKPSTNLQYTSGSSSMNSTQSLQLRAQGRGINCLPQMSYQSTGPSNQANRISPPTQVHAAKRNPVQSRGQPSLQASGQQFAHNPASGSQVSSPPKAALNKSSFEPGEKETTSELSKSKAALVVKGKGSAQGSGRGSFLYGGAQVVGASGNLGSGHGDQNFPTFLPVMQFGGQHPGGIGVPAVGMAFPGYVARPQLGLGNSEMTWLPVLAGAAGALGATYCSPYMSMDGSYNIRPSGQASSTAAASIKESNADKPSNEWNNTQRPEVGNDDFGQRQKNPRRYTEMKFDQ